MDPVAGRYPADMVLVNAEGMYLTPRHNHNDIQLKQCPFEDWRFNLVKDDIIGLTISIFRHSSNCFINYLCTGVFPSPWTLISVHDTDGLGGEYGTKTFTVTSEKWYRYFRVVTQGKFFCQIAGIELYGNLLPRTLDAAL